MKNSNLYFRHSALLLLLLSPFYPQNHAAQAPSCTQEDRAALLSFKAGILKDTTGILSTWVGIDCCGAWEGIECDPKTGRVIRLQLQRPLESAGQALYMKGILSPSLGKLQFLQVMILSGMKQIRGVIPESLSGLGHLTQLYLENSLLEGPIPSSIGKLTSLMVLSLSDNRLQGQIPQNLGFLRNLIQINLGKNSLTGTVPSTFRNFRSMQSLDLSHNLLSGEIPSYIGMFQNLTYLDLSNNQLSGVIPISLCSLSNVLDISLSHNNLTGLIPNQIGNLKLLNSLSLSSNFLTGSIPESLGGLQKLWYLNLSQNELSNPLPNSFRTGLPSLISIDLSYNNFHLDANLGWIIGRELRDVNLAGCNIGETLPVFTRADLLTSIDLSNNNLTGNIGDFLTNMTNLQVLKLFHNQLRSNITDIMIPDSLFILDLHSNQLYGSASDFLQKGSSFLESVDISSNKITGRLPQFSEGFSLKYLDLSKNSITGQIPSSISNLTSLERLDISRNQIMGFIPATMGELVRLQWLDISSNKLTGSIPTTFSGLSNIRHVSFRANNLCGQIPQVRPFNIFPAAAYAYNHCLCGQPLPPCKKI